MPSTKAHSIRDWKSRGLIYDDYDDLYEIYIKTMKCDHCNKDFKNTTDRCMDHNHETGKFRKIVCRACNTGDSYIKYPNGFNRKKYEQEYRDKYKEEIKEKRGQKITCLCGSVIRNDKITHHLNTQLHLNKMDKYMENID